MKKIFATLAILGAMTFGLTSNVLAQDDEFFQEESEQVVEEAAEAAPAAEEPADAPRFCVNCGHKLPEVGSFCINCGRKI